MRIGCDIDGVLADFNSSFIEKIIEVTGKDLFPARPFDIPEWNYPEHFGYTQDESMQAFKAAHLDRHFWRNLAPYSGTGGVLAELARRSVTGDDIYFITARTGIAVKQQTEDWLLQNCPLKREQFRPTVLITPHKAEACNVLNLDLYVDDNRDNANNVHFNTGTRVFIYDQPWNRDGFDPYSRVTSVHDMLRRAGL